MLQRWQTEVGRWEISAGLARFLTHRWALGVEIRDHNELPDYHEWQNTAILLGPVISYHRLVDKTIFLAARAEHFWVSITCFAFAGNWIAGGAAPSVSRFGLPCSVSVGRVNVKSKYQP